MYICVFWSCCPRLYKAKPIQCICEVMPFVTFVFYWIFRYPMPAPPAQPNVGQTAGHLPICQINAEAPACVQNAMMTKDKKPFTYTPGGIDLSQIKSPRMAKRLALNASSEGVKPKTSPLAQASVLHNWPTLVHIHLHTQHFWDTGQARPNDCARRGTFHLYIAHRTRFSCLGY